MTDYRLLTEFRSLLQGVIRGDIFNSARGRVVLYTVLTSLAHLAILGLVVLAPSMFGVKVLELDDVQLYYEHTSHNVTSSVADLGYSAFSDPFLLFPRLFTAQERAYETFFTIEMLLFDVLLTYLVAVRVARTDGLQSVPSRLAWYTVYVLTLSPLVFTRFDIVPTAITFAATLAWFSSRPALGGVGIALATLIKVFPASIGGVGFVYEASHRKETRFLGTVVFALSLALGVVYLWGFGGGAEYLGFHLQRGLLVETLPAGMLMMVGKVTGIPMRTIHSHYSTELVMRGTRFISLLTLPMQAIALLIVLWKFWRAHMPDPMRYVIAAVLAVLVPAKIVSPQYLIWLVPFISALEGQIGRWARRVFLLCCLANLLLVLRYGDLELFDPLTIGILNTRNAVLLVLLVGLTFAATPRVAGSRVQRTAHP